VIDYCYVYWTTAKVHAHAHAHIGSMLSC
jgi:hypothetical protein